MAILIVCRACLKHVDYGEIHDVKCLDCRIKRVTQSEQDEVKKLYRKAQRYGTKGVSLANIRLQANRLFARAYRKAVQEGIAKGGVDRVNEIMRDIFKEYEEKVVEPRIVVPASGDLIKRIESGRSRAISK